MLGLFTFTKFEANALLVAFGIIVFAVAATGIYVFNDLRNAKKQGNLYRKIDDYIS